MIPKKIRALFELIDFLDTNKIVFVKIYIPLCNELKELDKKRRALNPNLNYKYKQSFDNLQKLIEQKFEPITENVYKPVTSKMLELGIWSGDDVYTSIWNNNIAEISDFKRNFEEEDLVEVFKYKQKYLNFRTETNNDFLCLSFVFSKLDEIFKEIFDFFKDTTENEFGNFEKKTIEVRSLADLAQSIKDNNGDNVKYSISNDVFFEKMEIPPLNQSPEIKNEVNVFNIGDNIEVGQISSNKGSINVGKDNKMEIDGNDKISKKSFQWQKKDTIISVIIGIIGLIIAYISMRK